MDFQTVFWTIGTDNVTGNVTDYRNANRKSNRCSDICLEEGRTTGVKSKKPVYVGGFYRKIYLLELRMINFVRRLDVLLAHCFSFISSSRMPIASLPTS